jgi:predicted RNase H-like HicB family nuclease
MKILGTDGYATPNIQIVGGIFIGLCSLGEAIFALRTGGSHAVFGEAGLMSSCFFWVAWRGFRKRQASVVERLTGPEKIQAYMKLPYTVIMTPDNKGACVAQAAELEGCVAHGKNEKEALAHLKLVQEQWIKDRIQSGQRVPTPKLPGD